jgi:hypothetical protein
MLKINNENARLVFDSESLQDSQTSKWCVAKRDEGATVAPPLMFKLVKV